MNGRGVQGHLSSIKAFLETGVTKQKQQKTNWLSEKSVSSKLFCLSTIIFLSACKGSAFFTGRSLGLIERCCRFLPVSLPYPQGNQPKAPQASCLVELSRRVELKCLFLEHNSVINKAAFLVFSVHCCYATILQGTL